MQSWIGRSAILTATMSLAMPVAAADEIAARFGARESIQQISLSPDGTHVAIIMTAAGRGNALQIADLAGGPPKPILASSGNPERLNDCHWSTDTRLVCRIATGLRDGNDILRFTRTIVIDRDGKNMKMLSARTNDRSLQIMQNGGSIIDWTANGAPGSTLMTRVFVPERTTGTNIAATGQGLGVERVDTVSLARRTIEPPRADAEEYISDGQGNVRIMGLQPRDGSYDTNRINYFYRRPDDRDWKKMGAMILGSSGDSGFNPYAVDSKLNVAYGFDGHDGRRALFKVALDGTLKRDLVLARPDVDVDELITIGRQNRVVGATYATERREIEFFDPSLRDLGTALRKALPGSPLISFVDASADERTLLLFAGSDTDPGRYYVLDRASRHMAEILPARPELAKTPLATVKPISFRAADGTMIPGYLTLPVGSDGKNLPAIVMPHGGPSARDEWGFDWLSQYFAARGFAVLQPNFRGSAGYGSAWFQKNGFQSWRTAIGDVDDAGRWLVAQGIAAPTKLAIVGWSYGGYAALQSSVLDPGLFKAIVAVAPVTDLETLRSESANFTNHAIVDTFIGHGPHVRDGSPAQNAARIKVPVLMFHGDLDSNVEIGESRLMANRLRAAGGKVELVEFHGLDHQLADDGARATMLSKADTFLRASLGM